MATVTLNGVTYDSADLADGGHRDATVGFFAILTAMVAELAAADTVGGVSPGTSGNALVSNGSGWTSGRFLPTYAEISDSSLALDALQAVAALGSARHLLRMNTAGTGLEFGYAGLTKVAETTLASPAADITFSSIPSFGTDLILSLSARTSAATTTTALRMQINGDSTAIYDYQRHITLDSTNSSGGFVGQTSWEIGEIPGASAASANLFGDAEIKLGNYANTSRWRVGTSQVAAAWDNAAGNHYFNGYALKYRGTTAVGSVRLFPASGNFATGTIATLWVRS